MTSNAPRNVSGRLKQRVVPLLESKSQMRHRRPISPKAQAKYLKQLPKLNLFTIEQAFGGWAKADKAHFADGGSFDQIYLKK